MFWEPWNLLGCLEDILRWSWTFLGTSYFHDFSRNIFNLSVSDDFHHFRRSDSSLNHVFECFGSLLDVWEVFCDDHDFGKTSFFNVFRTTLSFIWHTIVTIKLTMSGQNQIWTQHFAAFWLCFHMRIRKLQNAVFKCDFDLTLWVSWSL